MNDLPPPTDDELLRAFVDLCPYMAMDDYHHRTGVDYRLTPTYIYERFEMAWAERMGDMK